jgi:hypothetical protein
MKADLRARLTQSIEVAAGCAEGLVAVDVIDGESMLFSQNFACPDHGVSLPELQRRIFSFSAPHGACPRCTGLGRVVRVLPRGNPCGIRRIKSGHRFDAVHLASEYWKQMTGRYPSWGYPYVDAYAWDDGAASKGWAYRSWPRPDSIAVWQQTWAAQVRSATSASSLALGFRAAFFR